MIGETSTAISRESLKQRMLYGRLYSGKRCELNFPSRETSLQLPPLVQTAAKRYKQITDVPEDILITIRVRMYALGALVWDYVDSLIDMYVTMRKPETKKITRAVREVKADYDYFRRLKTDAQHRGQELEWALDFEAHTDSHMKQLIRGIKQEHADLFGTMVSDTSWFLMGVEQALCVLEALQIYVRGCDKALERYGVDMRNKTLLPKQFNQLAKLLPEYGGGLLAAKSPVRRTVAENLAKELTKIVVSDASGDLQQPEMNL